MEKQKCQKNLELQTIINRLARIPTIQHTKLQGIIVQIKRTLITPPIVLQEDKGKRNNNIGIQKNFMSSMSSFFLISSQHS